MVLFTDIVLDNAGLDLIADLALADYLTSKNLCKNVYFHVKSMPWYMSDVTAIDVKWSIDQLCKMYEEPALQVAGDSWSKNFENHVWIIKPSDFWSLPTDFAAIHKYNRSLYEDLQKSKMIFIKGDLSYRKLFREYYHNPETPIAEAQGNFAPAKLCAIRIMKAEIVCGLPKGVADRCEEENSKWMESGQYGLIQYSDKKVPLMEEIDPRKLVENATFEDSEQQTTNKYAPECLCRK